MIRAALCIALMATAGLPACSTNKPFMPVSEYPPDPYVKGYADDQDCLGGEDLAAIDLTVPNYPAGPYRSGRQGWVIVRLDVAEDGTVARAEAERSVPDGMFESAALKGVRLWRFEPPAGGALSDCRVLVRFRAGEVTIGG